MDIRKISIGTDYKAGMHYVVGQSVLGDTHKIHAITMQDDGWIDVYIENGGTEIMKWKSISPAMPSVIECNINF
jgi:hypothetical protein